MNGRVTVRADRRQMVVESGEKALVISVLGKAFPIISVDRTDRSNLYVGRSAEKAKAVTLDYFKDETAC